MLAFQNKMQDFYIHMRTVVQDIMLKMCVILEKEKKSFHKKKKFAKGGFYRALGLESDLMWDFLDAIQSSNVIQRIDGWRQSSMETENLEKELEL